MFIKENVKKMEMFGVATITNIARKLFLLSMLADMASLVSRFNWFYKSTVEWHSSLFVGSFCNCIYHPKRIINRTVHHRKFALFTCGNGQGQTT
jgi:hypothetical protein